MMRMFNRRAAADGSIDWRWIATPVTGFAVLAAVLLPWQALEPPADMRTAHASMAAPQWSSP